MTGNAAYVHCPVLLALAGAHGHEPIHSALEVTFNQSGRIAWKGANANGYQIRSMVGEVDVMITSTILYFIWNSGYIEAEAEVTRPKCARSPTSSAQPLSPANADLRLP